MHSVQFSSVAQSCPTLCDPVDRSTPGLPVHRQLPELAQTHVHRAGDATQPPHPLPSPSPPAFSLSRHQGLSLHSPHNPSCQQRRGHSFPAAAVTKDPKRGLRENGRLFPCGSGTRKSEVKGLEGLVSSRTSWEECGPAATHPLTSLRIPLTTPHP